MYYQSKMEALSGAMKSETEARKRQNKEQYNPNDDLSINDDFQAPDMNKQEKNILLIGYQNLSNSKHLIISIEDLKNMVNDAAIKNSLEQVIENRYSKGEIESKKDSLDLLEKGLLSDQEYINLFNDMFNERLAAVDLKTLEHPSILIQYSEAEELKSNSIFPFAEGNKMLEELEEKYQNDVDYKKTKYHLIFPENKNLDISLSVIDMGPLDIGTEKYINPLHQINKEATLTPGQKKLLDENVTNFLLNEEKTDIANWFNKRKVIPNMER